MGDEVVIDQGSLVLPVPIRKRLNALKNLQLNGLNLEAEFFSEVYKLECKYHSLFKELFDKREKIINGIIEPTDEESTLALPSMDEPLWKAMNAVDPLLKHFKEADFNSPIFKGDCKGIPDFWLTIFKNVELLNDMVQPHDEPILKFLTDVQLVVEEEKMGFQLLFLFAPNKYFTNSCLTKQYEMKCAPDDTDPWSFEGPEIYKCKGCTIDWNKSMNVTIKTIRKRQRHKSRGAVRTVVKCVQNDSFFNFFNPPLVPDGGEVDEETQALLTTDFEIGHYIKDKIIPRAVLYFTGEALEDEYDEGEDLSESEEDFENEEGDDDDDDEDDDDEEDEEDDSEGNDCEGDNKNAVNHKGPAKGKTKAKNKNNKDLEVEECAQQ